MRRRRVASIALLAIVLASCATQAVMTDRRDRTPLEQAKLQYVALSLDYEFAMKSLESFSKAGALTTLQRAKLNAAQEVAREWTPLIRSMLDAWEQFGEKPANYDAALEHMKQAVQTAQIVSAEVHP